MVSLTEAQASDAAGLEIFYRHVEDSTYEFTVTFYRNCFSIAAGPTFVVNYRSLSTGKNGSFNCNALPTYGPGVPALVPPNLYNCTGAGPYLCYEEYVFRGTWTSPVRADDWVFSTTRCCRGGSTNVSSTIQYVECGLNNLDFPDGSAKNSSPFWHNRRPNHPGHLTDTVINYLFRTLCMDNYYTVDMSVREYQGDSVSYDFYWPQSTGGAKVVYSSGWSFVNPLPVKYPPLKINPVTGIFPIIPGAPVAGNKYILGIEATEWRNDTIHSGSAISVVKKKIGYVRRDMTVFIDDTITCRHDSVHPKNITLSSAGDTVLDVFFHNGKSGDPNSQVRCETLSPDGSEFRILDYSNYVYPFDSTIRSIGVNRAEWQCNAGVTPKVTLHLAEKLKCQEYKIMLKTGTDLDVIESECGFLEPEYSEAIITIIQSISVNIDTNKAYLTYCLPTENPFPKITASSVDSSSFPLHYYWTHNGDTMDNQGKPFIYARYPGKYHVYVVDDFNCIGSDKITVFHDTTPNFRFDLPPYCDRQNEIAGLPGAIWAPENASIAKWEWFNKIIGKVGDGDTLKRPNLIEDVWYTLKGTKAKIDNHADKACSYEYEFYYGRDSFPPLDPLWVKFSEDQISLCSSDGDTAWLNIWEEGIRSRFKPFQFQWYNENGPIPGDELSRKVRESGTYSLYLEDSLGCWGSDTITVTKLERIHGPDIKCSTRDGQAFFLFTWPENEQILANEVSLDNGATWIPSSNGFIHSVNYTPGQDLILGRGLVSGPCQWTEFSLSDECPDDVSLPNVITPNGDGLNEVFKIEGLEFYKQNALKIYDRWGNIIYQTDDYKNDWSGIDQPSGTYFYVLIFGDEKKSESHGTLTLLR